MRDGWIEYKFKDVAQATKGKLPKSKNQDGLGHVYLTANYLRTGKPDFWIEKSEELVIAEQGDCLILWDGAGAGDLFPAKSGVVSSTMAVVTTCHQYILSDFLTLCISSKASYIKETCRGTTVPHVSPDAISNMDILIPPLADQKRIVDLMSSIDSYIDKLQKSLTNSDAAFESALDAQLKTFMDHAPQFKLEDLCVRGKSAIVDGPFGANLKREDYLATGIPVLKIQNIKRGFILLKKMDFVSESKFIELSRHSFEKNDIIMTKLGDPLGLSAIVTDLDRGLIVADLVRIRPNKVDVEFLCLQLNSARIRNHINRMQKGSTRPRVNLGMIRELPIVVPSNQEIQAFLAVFETWNHSNLRLGEAINSAGQLRKAILTELLSGNHEIPEGYDKLLDVAP